MINFTLYVSLQTSELFQNILWRDTLDLITGKNVINPILPNAWDAFLEV